MCNQMTTSGIDVPAAHDWRGRHAGTGSLRPAIHARVGRAEGAGCPGCHRVSRAAGLGAGRAAGRRGVLHPVRLLDHRPAAGPVGGRRAAEAGRFLGPAGPAAAAGPVRDAGRGDRVGDPGRPGPARRAARRGRRRGDLLLQLVPDHPGPVLLRQVRPARAAGPPVVPGRGGAVLPGLALATLILAGASAAVMLALYHPGLDPTRVYEGTDTRAAGLLIGAALAMTWPSRRPAPGRAVRALLDVGGFAGLAMIALMIWRTGQYSPFLYRGGLVLLSFASAAVIAAVAVPSALTGRVLGCRPLRWLGVRSYGIYLWHYPVIVLTTPANSTENLVRAACQTAVTIVVAALSWRYIEEPIRRGALARVWKQVRATTARPAGAHAAVRTGRAGALAAAPTALAAVAAAAVLVTASAGLSGAFSAPAATNAASLAGSSLPAPSGHGSSPAAGAQPAPARAGNKLPSSGSATALRTSCNAVAHLGDSTSEGMVSAAYLANPNQRLVAQYHDVGVKKVVTNIVGANSIVETLPGDTNGYNAAKDIVKQGFKGCWVIALGTNDAADVAIGSSVDPAQRISEIMSVAHGSPVLWVNVVSTLNSGPYAESSMQTWNTALNRACAKYPNMRVFNWASLVQPSWFISDGIHYTSAGYAQRSEQIADALAKAFPAKGHSSGCMVS